MKMSEDKAKSLMAIADGLIQSIKNYDRNFNLAREKYHDCVLTGYLAHTASELNLLVNHFEKSL